MKIDIKISDEKTGASMSSRPVFKIESIEATLVEKDAFEITKCLVLAVEHINSKGCQAFLTVLESDK